MKKRAPAPRAMIIVAAAAVAVLLARIAAPAASAQDNSSPSVFPPDSAPYGKTYAEWSVEWSQWALTIQADQNPLTDPDGQFCDVGQPDDQVFFLASNFGGTTVRNCTVPAEHALLLSPGGVACFLHVDGETEEELRACAEEAIATIFNLAVDIDGVPVENLTNYEVTTPLFSFTLPPDNILELPEGEQQAVDISFFLMLEPLPEGEHVIHMHDEFPDDFVSDVTYMLTITAAPAPTAAATQSAPGQLPANGAGPAPAGDRSWAFFALLLGGTVALATGALLFAAGGDSRRMRP